MATINTPNHENENPNKRLEKNNPDDKVALMLKTLEHAVSCNDIECTSQDCKMMKELMLHAQHCNEELTCIICKRYFGLLQKHAQSCSKLVYTCPIPFCCDFQVSCCYPMPR